MLPRYILCVLFTLVLCCSYVSLVSAASYETTGKSNNLMHGRNSSLSAEPLGDLHRRLKYIYHLRVERVIAKLEQARKRAQREMDIGENWTKAVSKALNAVHNIKYTIDALTVPEKDKLIKLYEETLQKVQQAYDSADQVRSGADFALGFIPSSLRIANKITSKINNAQETEDAEIDRAIWSANKTANEYFIKMRERREKASREIIAAKVAMGKFDQAKLKAIQKQKEQQQKKETVGDTSSTEVTQTQVSKKESEQVTQKQNSQQENIQMNQSSSVKEEIKPVAHPPNETGQTSPSQVNGEEGEHQPKQEREAPSVTEEATESLSATLNIPNLIPVNTDSQAQVTDNAAEEENYSFGNAQEQDEEEILERDQEKEGLKTPEVKPVGTTEKDKTRNEGLEKDAQESRVNTENINGTSDLNNSSIASIRNDMDGTNIIGWVPSLPIMFILLTVFPFVILG